ncbi:MAG: hypothetical protein CM15mP85_11310 [Rhodobacterales bacterium]|nr:MAG: hypothetical protein CM15mP85_11310 [Rhodobacterales bacterium]
MADEIDYGNLMHNAMRSLIQDVLTEVKNNGLPGEHHFFITFDTNHAGVEMASWLKDRYPTEITVVMQHWYDDLEVKDDGFSVTLNFGDNPEHLVIPYEAILTFVDPSVEFGLRFETNEEDEDTDEQKPTVSKESNKDDTKKETGQVVSLDNFRK